MNSSPYLNASTTQPFGGIYQGKRVFVTGHTGFKGSWLAFWLTALGAEVCGYSLPPPTRPSLFGRLRLDRSIRDVRGDIRDLPRLRRVLRAFRPDFLFHLAAQPIVLASYRDTPTTFATNVMGTVFVLEALRDVAAGRGRGPRAAVLVTSDKVYRPWSSPRAHAEEDPLGGVDPYSLSKAACEMAIAAYRTRYPDCPVVSARAGNVIGGGDWAPDRIIPDCLRAWSQKDSVRLRHPRAVRPWQHVLEPLSGYLALGAALAGHAGQLRGEIVEGLKGNFSQLLNSSTPQQLSGQAFNFGPERGRRWTVEQVVAELAQHLGGRWKKDAAEPGHRESHHLEVDSRLARRKLGWRPAWDTRRAIRETARWFREAGRNPEIITRTQILEYTADAARKAIPWTHT